MKKCILNKEKICNDCGECDNLCQLDPSKECTNCFKCIDGAMGEYASVRIDDILLSEAEIDGEEEY
jgi:hypothetical protein